MKRFSKYAAVVLLLLLGAVSLTSCSGTSEVPDGYQYATCAGEYFRLFVPTQWTVNTESGVSGAFVTIDTAVTMRQVPYEPETEGTENALESFLTSFMHEVSVLSDYQELYAVSQDEVDGFKAWRLNYTARVAGTMYTFRQVLTKAGGRFYVFTYSAPSDKFDDYTDIVDEIQEEIRFYNDPYEGSGETNEIPNDVTAPEGMKLISTDEVAFRFFVPTAWETDPESAAFLSWVTESDGSRSNVSMLTYMPDDEGYSVDDYWAQCVVKYENTLPSFELLSVDGEGEPGGEAGKIGDRDAKLYTYTYTLGGNRYKVRQAVCVYATSVYTITYTALEEHFDSHIDEVDAMQEAVVFRSPFKKE